jgi:outer membrane protein assembly factor BamE (lipoprotein component of BamABCDE complex)
MVFSAAMRRGHGTGLSWLAVLVCCVSLALAGCTPIRSNHGYVPSDEDLALVAIGVDTRDSVAATIGRPAVSDLLGDDGWYYIQSQFVTQGAAAPVEVDREVVAITFGATGLVENVERFGLDQGRIVPLSRRVTTTNIRGKGVLAQIFGNIGRLNTDNLFQ